MNIFTAERHSLAPLTFAKLLKHRELCLKNLFAIPENDSRGIEYADHLTNNRDFITIKFFTNIPRSRMRY
jgi:hypothetical protein